MLIYAYYIVTVSKLCVWNGKERNETRKKSKPNKTRMEFPMALCEFRKKNMPNSSGSSHIFGAWPRVWGHIFGLSNTRKKPSPKQGFTCGVLPPQMHAKPPPKKRTHNRTRQIKSAGQN